MERTKCIIPLSILQLTVWLSLSLYGGIRDPNQQADLLIITPEKWQDVLTPYLTYRQNSGIKAVVITLEQIQREFPVDTLLAESIHQAIWTAVKRWQAPAPGSVLLVGDAEYLPSFQLYNATMRAWYTIDQCYALSPEKDSRIPQLAIGRFPVNTEEELALIIQKTIAFENRQYLLDFTAVTDSADQKFFSQQMDSLAGLIPRSVTWSRIDTWVDSPNAGNRADLLRTFDEGCRNLLFLGHTNEHQWMRDSLLLITNLARLNPAAPPSLVILMGCDNNFALAHDSTIVERLLFQGPNGAAATLAPAGVAWASESMVFLTHFYKDQWSGMGHRVGESVRNAFAAMHREDPFFEIHSNQTYTLLGDPCATVRWGLTANVQKAPKNVPQIFTLLNNYPNPFNPETTIKYHLNGSAEIRLQVFNMHGQLIRTLHSGMQSAGTHSVIWNSTDDSGHSMASGLYLIQLQSGGHCRQIKAVLLR